MSLTSAVRKALPKSDLAIGLCRLADGLGSGILLVAIPLFIVELPRGDLIPDSVLVGIVVALYSLVSSVLQPLMGRLSDRLQWRKPFIQGGFLIMGLTSLGYLALVDIGMVVLVRTVQGVGLAMVIPPVRALIVNEAANASRGRSMGIFRSLRMLGLAVGPLLAGYLQVRWGFDMVFTVGAATMLLGLIPVQLWVNENRTPGNGRRTASVGFSNLKVQRQVLGLLTAVLMVGASFSMVLSMEAEMAARYRMTVIGFGTAFSVFTFSRLVLEIPMGVISDWLGRRKLVMAGLTLMVPATMLLALTRTSGQLMALRLVQGVAAAAIAGPALVLAAEVSQGGVEGQHIGLVGMGFGLGSVVGPMLGGTLVQVGFAVPFVVVGLLEMLAVVLIWRSLVATREKPRLNASIRETDYK